MYAERNEERKNRAWGIAATVFYVLLWCLLIYFVSFPKKTPERIGEGILINFGSTETGFGEEDLPDSDETAPSQQASQSSPDVPENRLTQDFEEAPAVADNPQERQPETTAPSSQPDNRTETAPSEPTREVDRRALFPGRSDTRSTSEGNTEGSGNQGNLAGDPTGSHSGTGLGDSGNSYNLSGRSLVGSLPVPEYNAREEGRVVIEIRVDQQGNVISASFRSVGSTTTHNVLVSAAQRAAMRAKFNVDETAPHPQVGTIIYNFRMR